MATRALYGYQKDDNDPKRKIVPDENAAPVVQRIFSHCAGGKGPTQITKLLKKEQVLTPDNYYYSKTGILLTNVDTTSKGSGTISDINGRRIWPGCLPTQTRKEKS